MKEQNISDGISFGRLGHVPGVGLRGGVGGWGGGSKIFFRNSTRFGV